MALIEFKNTHDLINYLCREDVLGELEIAYTQEYSSALTPSFNFIHPALEKHLEDIAGDWFGYYGSTCSKVYLTFQDAEDLSVTVEDDLEYSDNDLSESIYAFVRDQIFQEYEKDTYLLIDIEGTDFNMEKITVKKLEIYDFESEEAPIELEEDLRKMLLQGILKLLEGTKTSVIDVDSFYLQNSDGQDDIDFCVEGTPDAHGWYDLEDGVAFILDTEAFQSSTL